MTIGTLHYWAKKDNMNQYNIFRSTTLTTLIDDSLSGSDTKIAKLMAELIKDEWIYSGKVWFHFDGNRWNNEGDGRILYNEFDKLINLYASKRIQYNESLLELKSKDSDKVKLYEDKQNKISKIIRKIETVSFMDSVIKRLSALIKEDNFESRLNTNIFLMGLADGVYDINNGTFRKSIPSDMISMSCGWTIEEIQGVSEDNEMKIKRITEEIFPNEEERTYMMNLYATCLNGNTPPMFQINAGYNNQGGNGKSFMRNLMIYALGEYATEFSVTLLTQKRGKTNSASPELAKLVGVRFACCSEPENQSRINGSVVKEMTGGGKQQCRLLYSNNNSFVPQYTLFLECNKRPAVDAEDGGIFRRFRVCEFKSLFIEDESKINPSKNIYLMDHELGLHENQKVLGLYLLKVLIRIHSELLEQKKHLSVPPPASIRISTMKYFNETNVFIGYLYDSIEKTDNIKDYISFQKLYNSFTDSDIYFNLGKHKRPTKKDCLEYLLKSDFFEFYHCKENSSIQVKHPIIKNPNVLGYHRFIPNE